MFIQGLINLAYFSFARVPTVEMIRESFLHANDEFLLSLIVFHSENAMELR